MTRSIGATALALAVATWGGSSVADPATASPAADPPGITQPLAGEPELTIDGRAQRLLGARRVTDAAGRSQILVVLRDTVSGQISHRLSALQFRLVPGADPEAFVREHPGMTRWFVNALYTQVHVEPTALARLHAELLGDPRVIEVRLMSVPAPARLKK